MHKVTLTKPIERFRMEGRPAHAAPMTQGHWKELTPDGKERDRLVPDVETALRELSTHVGPYVCSKAGPDGSHHVYANHDDRDADADGSQALAVVSPTR